MRFESAPVSPVSTQRLAPLKARKVRAYLEAGSSVLGSSATAAVAILLLGNQLTRLGPGGMSGRSIGDHVPLDENHPNSYFNYNAAQPIDDGSRRPESNHAGALCPVLTQSPLSPAEPIGSVAPFGARSGEDQPARI
jgi:hypothetical protein